MKSISAAIIVVAGAAVFVAGIYHPHDQTEIVVCVLGIALAIVGLVGWITTLRGRD